MTPVETKSGFLGASFSGYLHTQPRIQERWTFTAIIALVAGLLTNLRFQLGGRASAGEVVLAVVAIFAVLANVGNTRFWNRRMLLILAALCITFCAYVVSDLINATPSDRLVRGWARMAFVIVNFIAIWALARNRIMNLFAVCVGDALSTMLSYGEDQRDFLYNYKFHLAMPLTVLIMIITPLILRRRAPLATGIAMAGAGMCHLWLDFRMLGAICILIGFVLMARCMTASRLRSLYLSLLAMALVLSSIATGYIYTTTNPAFAERREDSNSERLSLALAGINAIERSPIFGLGSWVWDTEMWEVFAGKMGRADTTGVLAGETMGPHSQLIQVWAEAGVLGLVFFVYYGKLLSQALWILFFRRPLDFMTPLFLYYLFLGLWNLVFSPFANLHRFDIGLALVISLQVLREFAPARRVQPPSLFGASFASVRA
jgi:hypothetical protein